MSSSIEVVTVKIDEKTEILAEVEQLGGEEDVAFNGLNIDGAMSAVKGIADRIHDVLSAAKPQKASVEFGVKLAASEGKLTGLLVNASGDASFKITLEWQEPSSE